jgi:hypothetical protein
MVFVVVVGVAVLVVLWPILLLGHAVDFTPTLPQLVDRGTTWMHRHYPLVGLRIIAAVVVAIVVLIVASRPLRERRKARAIERRRLAAEQEAERVRRVRIAHEQWLAGPPPALDLPGRFTQNWIKENVPRLHPGQVSALTDELYRRGWTDDDITQRISPYLPSYASAL